MAQGMDAHEENKELIKKLFGPRKKPAGAAGEALKPAPKKETDEERNKREHDEVMRLDPKDRQRLIDEQNERRRKGE